MASNGYVISFQDYWWRCCSRRMCSSSDHRTIANHGVSYHTRACLTIRTGRLRDGKIQRIPARSTFAIDAGKRTKPPRLWVVINDSSAALYPARFVRYVNEDSSTDSSWTRTSLDARGNCDTLSKRAATRRYSPKNGSSYPTAICIALQQCAKAIIFCERLKVLRLRRTLSPYSFLLSWIMPCERCVNLCVVNSNLTHV